MAWTGLVFTTPGPAVAVEQAMPDTQAPAFRAIISRYTAALTEAQAQHVTAMSRHIKKYLDEAEDMLAEKKKARNTTGIAVASTFKNIFETALTNLTATGTFAIPAKVRRELEATMAEFNAGRTLLENALVTKKAALLKKYSDEFAALVLVLSPDLKSPEARKEIDERFVTMAENKMPPPSPATAAPAPTVATPAAAGGKAPAATDEVAPPASNWTIAPTPGGAVTSATGAGTLASILEESGQAASWITAATFTASINHMEVFELSLTEMHPGKNVIRQFNPITETTTEALYDAAQTNITNPAMVFRLKRIPGCNGVNVADWPRAGNDYHLTVRTARPEQVPFPIGFELQIGIPGKDVADMVNTQGGGSRARSAIVRNITLTIKSTPPGAIVFIDGDAVANKFTPCAIPVSVGTHSFRLSLSGYKDLTVPSFVFTADRQINWTFKPVGRASR